MREFNFSHKLEKLVEIRIMETSVKVQIGNSPTGGIYRFRQYSIDSVSIVLPTTGRPKMIYRFRHYVAHIRFCIEMIANKTRLKSVIVYTLYSE